MKIKSNDNQKIIFVIGVHNNDLVTSHCLAFNWDIDLTWLDHIVPCGIEGKGVTSLSKEMNIPITIQDAQSYLFEQFEKLYSCQIIESDEKFSE